MARRDITIAPQEWEETGPDNQPWSRLTLRPQDGLTINGLPMHTEAWAVDDTGEGSSQEGIGYGEEDLDSLAMIYECAFRTTEINGRDYVIVLVPDGA